MVIRPMDERTKPRVVLAGIDGNAFNIICIVNRGMQKAGWTDDEREQVLEDMMSGDYEHVLVVACCICEVM